MLNQEQIEMLKENVDLLFNKIDPQSKLKIIEDTILNSKFNRGILQEVLNLLDYILENKMYIDKPNRRTKDPFCLTEEQKNSIKISVIPIPISTFVYNINQVIQEAKIKKIKSTQITEWLRMNGYLQKISHDDGREFKILTVKSESIGMSSKRMKNAYGREYDINLYDENAQRLIINNINKM